MGICRFCREERKLTREHVVSDWISDHVARAFPRTEHNVFVTSFANDPAGQRERRRSVHAGDPLSRKLKIVCGNCNNGWMSRIVERAKPLVLPMLNGEVPNMDAVAQECVSAWMVLSAMVWEQATPDLSSTVRLEHTFIMNNERAPDNWRAWFGISAESMPTNYFHRASSAYVPGDELPTKCNMQSTFFTVGRLAFQAARAGLGFSLAHVSYQDPGPMTSVHPPSAVPARRPAVPFVASMVFEMQDEFLGAF